MFLMNNKDRFEVIVPFYNDFENFKKFDEIINAIDTKNVNFLYLDNGSNQNQIEEYLRDKKYDNRRYLKSDKNLGYGGGVIYAQKYSNGNYVAWMPGNLKIHPKDSIDFFNNIEGKVDKEVLIKAKRINRQTTDYIKTRIFGILSTIYFMTNLNDAGGTPSVVEKSFFKDSDQFPKDFSFDVFVYYFYRINNLKVIRPKIRYTRRYSGQSHWQKGLNSEIKLTLSIFNKKKEWKEIINSNN